MNTPWEHEDLELRRRRFAQIRESWQLSPGFKDVDAVEAYRQEHGQEARDAVASFLAGSSEARDLASTIDHWSRGADFGFAGPSGAMYLNQITKDSDGPEVQLFLRRALIPPTDVTTACLLVDELAELTAKLRERGSAAAVARAPFFLTWFWWLQSPSTWRPMWPSASAAIVELGWLPQEFKSQGARLSAYLDSVSELDEDSRTIEASLAWFDKNKDELGLDITLPDRCALTQKLNRDLPGPGATEQEIASYDLARMGMRAGIKEMARIGKLLAPAISEHLGIDCLSYTPGEYWVSSKKGIRGDLWVSWRPVGMPQAPGVRLHVSVNGVFFVINPEVNMNSRGYGKRLVELIPNATELNFFKVVDYDGPRGWHMDVVPRESITNNFNLGLQWSITELATATGLKETTVSGCDEIAPLFRELCADDTEGDIATTAEVDRSNLPALSQEFMNATGYPSDYDREQLTVRSDWAQALAPERIASLSKDRFRRIIAQRYGSPGPQSILNVTVRDSDDEQWSDVLTSIDFLLHGDGPVESRIDRVLDDSDLGVRGLKESVLMKLLAVADPDRFLPVYPFSGEMGKAALLEVMGSNAPTLQASAGQRQVQANDALRAITEPLFPNDPWGQMRFAYWLRERTSAEVTPTDEVTLPADAVLERLDELAPKVYVDSDFLSDIYGLLDDMKQVIFYGPPGTGKTYLAEKIAEAITPDEDHRMLVQFHPSTTYEDFFEGFRPSANANGTLSYTLAPGPLRLIAAEAQSNPDESYVLVIDEINRANLPKVFGELLFLLEYRDRPTRLLYEPDESFTLPPNLYIIGTMNTADRSVGLLDAAMRRRFHFVPFVPDHAGTNPISQVLARWVAENDELETLPDIVDKVNNQLRVLLGGDHLLLGPSYFMKEGIDEEQLRRIWRYQIEPLIDDLFFGQPAQAAQFRFDRVWEELGEPAVESQGN